MLQYIFGYHCQGDESLTGRDSSHVSLPQRTMLQRQNTHFYLWRGGRKSRKPNKRNTMSTEGLGATRNAEFQLVNTTKSCLSFSFSFELVNYDSLKLMNDVLFHLKEPICQRSGKVSHNLWLWWTAACVCRCVHTGNVCVCVCVSSVKCQSHAPLAITEDC